MDEYFESGRKEAMTPAPFAGKPNLTMKNSLSLQWLIMPAALSLIALKTIPARTEVVLASSVAVFAAVSLVICLRAEFRTRREDRSGISGSRGVTTRVFLTTWNNPQLQDKIDSIDFEAEPANDATALQAAVGQTGKQLAFSCRGRCW